MMQVKNEHSENHREGSDRHRTCQVDTCKVMFIFVINVQSDSCIFYFID